MTTIINTPPAGESSDSGIGLFLGIILAFLLVVLFFVYILPTFRTDIRTTPETNNIDVNVTVPENEVGFTPTVKP
jgi:hypothetical protein